MSFIKKIEIKNFRGIKDFEWLPSPGINCLIGPGDSGKSSVLDAIDLCLGARRNIQFTDADFHKLDVNNPLKISLTLGNLEDGLKTIDTYGLYLRGFDPETGNIADEPESGLDTVLVLQLTVENDLEPQWTLESDRAAAQNKTRSLTWADRVLLAPTRLGAIAEHNLSWRYGSILNKLSEEKADASKALVMAARNARTTFGTETKEQLDETLKIVAETAKDLGIQVGNEVQALLDAHSISFSSGAISLHDESGVPLRGLGLGSARLLIAGLQKYATQQTSIILIDELEHGLEPHRIIRLLDTLGAKEKVPSLQVFMTTHSPVAVRELSGSQLFVMRGLADKHEARLVGTDNDVQATIRHSAEAFLAHSVIVCEGATEIGLLRGLDQYRINQGWISITACGVGMVDGSGESTFKRAKVFQQLGYRTAVFRDSDVPPPHALEDDFKSAGGVAFQFRDGRAVEDELFQSLSDDGVCGLIDQAIKSIGRDMLNEHIKSVSNGTVDLNYISNELIDQGFSMQSRKILGAAAKSKNNSWFKSISKMETVALDIIGPDLPNADPEFRAIIHSLLHWMSNDGQ